MSLCVTVAKIFGVTYSVQIPRLLKMLIAPVTSMAPLESLKLPEQSTSCISSSLPLNKQCLDKSKSTTLPMIRDVADTTPSYHEPSTPTAMTVDLSLRSIVSITAFVIDNLQTLEV